MRYLSYIYLNEANKGIQITELVDVQFTVIVAKTIRI